MSLAMNRFWQGRAHDLGAMSLSQLASTFFRYPAILVYLALALGSAMLAVITAKSVLPIIGSAFAAWLIWPLVWYLLHRFVLHGKFLFRSALTAALWKRIHFDHHQDPFDLRVLFGAVHTTLPPIALASIPVGLWIGGVPGAATAFSVGLLVTCLNEFVHCIQHLNVDPKWSLIRKMKQRHLAHHFHSEKGNYGIADFSWDHIFGTLFDSGSKVPKSSTVYNLGYDSAAAKMFPFVLALSGGQRHDDGPRRFARASSPRSETQKAEKLVSCGQNDHAQNDGNDGDCQQGSCRDSPPRQRDTDSNQAA